MKMDDAPPVPAADQAGEKLWLCRFRLPLVHIRAQLSPAATAKSPLRLLSPSAIEEESWL
jgi:hypothetical protein